MSSCQNHSHKQAPSGRIPIHHNPVPIDTILLNLSLVPAPEPQPSHSGLSSGKTSPHLPLQIPASRQDDVVVEIAET
jgi:hypothetical protein